MDLVSFRRQKGLSQEDVAKAVGVRSKSYISRIETQPGSCSLRLALKIERFTDGLVQARDLCPEAKDLLPVAADAGARA
jgi:DNA-binding XRE family transcriptional regulator